VDEGGQRDDAVAFCTAGFALVDVIDKLDDGEALIERALALNPNLAWTWLFSGWVKIYGGEPDAAADGVARESSGSLNNSREPRRMLIPAGLLSGRSE
jgi:hypothetical protein